MKKVLILIIELILISLVSAEVRINEVMADPNQCSDTDCEYIEIYSDSPINLTNWNINTTNQDYDFNFYLEDYLIITRNKNIFIGNFGVDAEKVIELSGISLVNNIESVFLFNDNSELIDDFTYEDTTPGISWQYCSNEWIQRNPTPGLLNNCSISQNNPPQNNQTQNTEQPADSKISIKIEFDGDEIINGEEFKIKIKTYNLKSKSYNFKIWIKDDDENIISDRYGEDSSEKEVWKSGNYYIYNLFEGPGNKTETIKLRIRKGFSNFSGDAEICFKLENQKCETIEVLKKEAVINKNNTEEIKTITKSSESTNSIAGNVIKLGSSESKETIINNQKNTNNSNLVYESKNEKTKKYAIIGFAILCLCLVILVLFKKIN